MNASAALIFFTFLAAIAVTLVGLIIGNSRLEPVERLRVTAALCVAIVAAGGLVRDPLPARVGDAAVAPLVLGAWLAARWVRPAWSWAGSTRTAVALVALMILARSVFVVGEVSPRLRRIQSDPGLWQRLTTSPPFDAWQAVGSAEYRIVRYVRACTAPREPLLVLWFAPQIYYYADRPFAGRFGFYIKGYWSAGEEQARNIAAIDLDRPTLAIIEAGREQIDLPSHGPVLAYLNEFYYPVGALTTSDGTVLRVYGRRDRIAASTDSELGWPCYLIQRTSTSG